MTYSNGSYNLNPLANPFNTRLGPANYTLNPTGQGRKLSINIKDKSLPDAVPYRNDMMQAAQLPQLSMREFLAAQQARYDNLVWRNEDIYRLADASQPQDDRYWKLAQEKSKKMEASITDEQKKMLNELSAMFPSKLELED